MATATGLTENEALARALDLSAAEARARNEAPLPLAQEGPNAGEFRPRSEAHPPLSHHFAQQVPAMGGIISRGALDQFHDFWSAAIGKHQTAGSICGYLTAANCELLSEAPECCQPKCSASARVARGDTSLPDASLPKASAGKGRDCRHMWVGD